MKHYVEEEEILLPQHPSVYQISRELKKENQSLWNCVQSILTDASFVTSIKQLWPGVPQLANLRCGSWYIRVSAMFDAERVQHTPVAQLIPCASDHPLNIYIMFSHSTHVGVRSTSCVLTLDKNVSYYLVPLIPVWTDFDGTNHYRARLLNRKESTNASLVRAQSACRNHILHNRSNHILAQEQCR